MGINRAIKSYRKQRYRKLRKLRKARDAASRETRSKEATWKLSIVANHFSMDADYRCASDLAHHIYLRMPALMTRAPKPPSRPVRMHK